MTIHNNIELPLVDLLVDFAGRFARKNRYIVFMDATSTKMVTLIFDNSNSIIILDIFLICLVMSHTSISAVV